MSRPATTTRTAAGTVRPPGPGSGTALALGLAALGLGVAASALLGPVGWGVLVYRTSDTTLNQLRGGDLASLLVVAPLCLVAALLVRRRRPAGPLLALGLGSYALYTYAQVVVGQEYLRLPGNVERFFPLLLAVFVLAEVVVVLAWRRLPAPLPVDRRLERVTGAVLLAAAAFLVVGLHLPSLAVAWTDPGSLTEYASSPTPFWLVKLMDLGVVVPAAAATGVGLLRGSGWARTPAYVLSAAFTCLGASVTTMALTMLVRADPDASLGLAAGFGLVTGALAVLTVRLYRPLLALDRVVRTPARPGVHSF